MLKFVAAAIAFVTVPVICARAEPCTAILQSDDFEWFRVTSQAALDDLGYSVVSQLLQPDDAEEPSSPSVWVHAQICPFDANLSPPAKKAIGAHGDLRRWTTVANALFQEQLLKAEPQFFSSMLNAVNKFEEAAGGKPAADQLRSLIEEVQKNAAANSDNTYDEALKKLYGPMIVRR